MAVVVHPEFVIETRRAVDDKFASAMEDLSLIAHVGDSRYRDEPAKAVMNLRNIDECFHTDIQSELRTIEGMLRRQQLEGTWYKEHDEGMAAATPEERDEAMREWVDEQLTKSDGSVSCALPASPSQKVRNGIAKVDHRSPATISRRMGRPGTVGDKVQCSDGQIGVVKRVRDGEVVVELEDGARLTLGVNECEVVEKAHPAKAVVAARPAQLRRPYSGPAHKSGTVESELSGLFSRVEEAGDKPGFLTSSERKKGIEDRKAAHISKMPSKRTEKPDQAEPKQLTASKTAASTSRFMDVHTKSTEAESQSRRTAVEKKRREFQEKIPQGKKA